MTYILIAVGLISLVSTIMWVLLAKKLRSEKQSMLLLQEKHKNDLEEAEVKRDRLIDDHKEQLNTLQRQLDKYQPIINITEESLRQQAFLNSLKEQYQELTKKYESSLHIYNGLETEISLYQDTLDLTQYGVYEPKYSFDFPEQYRVELEGIYDRQKQMVQLEQAAICGTEWTVGGSKVEGRKMTRQYIKLMLFAFNGECDALIAKIKWNNATKTIERIRKAFANVNKLGEVQNCRVTYDYLDLKLKELALTHEYEQKKYEEKEEQRRIREVMREEEKAQKEYERAQKEAEDEERRYTKALEKAKAELGYADQSELSTLTEKIKILEQNLLEAHERKERAISLAQTTKVGHIYVISNLGSFGEDVYKIGMTRRLDPLDRVRELGDASVPFQFDVHAIIYSDNAPQLEYELHKTFDKKRINRINGRKEFFKASLEEIEDFVKSHMGAEIQFTKLAEAKEYRETIKLLEQIKPPLSEVEQKAKFPQHL